MLEEIDVVQKSFAAVVVVRKLVGNSPIATTNCIGSVAHHGQRLLP